MLKNILKVVAAILLLLYLADINIGFDFRWVIRLVVSGTFAYLSYDYFKTNNVVKGFVFAALALLFQPFFSLAMSQMMWNLINILVIIGLVCLLLRVFRKK